MRKWFKFSWKRLIVFILLIILNIYISLGVALSALPLSVVSVSSFAKLIVSALWWPAYLPFVLTENSKYEVLGMLVALGIEVVYLWIVAGLINFLIRKVLQAVPKNIQKGKL